MTGERCAECRSENKLTDSRGFAYCGACGATWGRLLARHAEIVSLGEKRPEEGKPRLLRRVKR